jgi:GNAT superfamily N-acetyltransferase
VYEWRRDGLRITTDPAQIDLDVVHGFLTASYWAWGITRDRVERSIAGSIPFALFEDEQQVGFARVISDRATFAWVADVFVLPGFRGRGLGTWLMETVLAHPDLQRLRRWSLATRDAHSLYARFGFVRLASPERMMEFRPAGTDAGRPAPASAGPAVPTAPGGTPETPAVLPAADAGTVAPASLTQPIPPGDA